MSRKDWKRPKVEMPRDKRRIKLVISYIGTSFHGWQAQDNSSSVQRTIEDALCNILGERVSLFGSGRTDSGVHALGQVAHFDTTSSLCAKAYSYLLNSRLPKSIRILSSSEEKELFHARFTTMAREYWYIVKDYDSFSAPDWGRVTPLKRLPSLTLLNEYATLLEGTHDFTTFCSSRDISPSKVRDIYISKWIEERDYLGSRVYKYIVVGNAFLYNQVRSMVGTMVEAALKEESPDSFNMRLLAKDRALALKTFPPEGLYLARISYDENEYSWFEDR